MIYNSMTSTMLHKLEWINSVLLYIFHIKQYLRTPETTEIPLMSVQTPAAH